MKKSGWIILTISLTFGLIIQAEEKANEQPREQQINEVIAQAPANAQKIITISETTGDESIYEVNKGNIFPLSIEVFYNPENGFKVSICFRELTKKGIFNSKGITYRLVIIDQPPKFGQLDRIQFFITDNREKNEARIEIKRQISSFPPAMRQELDRMYALILDYVANNNTPPSYQLSDIFNLKKFSQNYVEKKLWPEE